MAGRLAGKIAIITGSGRGIGRVGAMRFAEEGAHVVVSDIDSENARKTADAIVAAGGKALCLPADVTDSGQVDALVRRVDDELGRVDVMWCNAGGALPEPTTDVTDEKLREVLALNLDGVFFGVRAALEVMVPRRSGSILVTTSGAGLGAVRGLTAYGMAKAGVINLAKNVAHEYGPSGIRANVVSPGPIESEGFLAYLDSVEGLRAKMEHGVPARRLGRPEDIANAAVYLSSDEASFVSGVVIPVDGGISSRYPTPEPDL
jgi:3-oxoacyl-[acyl-carrier protein] reductase